MQYMMITAVLFFALLMGPFLCAFLCCRREGKVLYIDQGYVKEPRYFGSSFAQMVEKSLAALEEGKLYLSKKESVRKGEPEELSEEVKEMVVCLQKDFKTPDITRTFAKEIYGGKNVEVAGKGVTLRAVYAKQNLILGTQTTVVRWADAEETVAVYDDCRLGISTTAGRRMSIGKNCTFQRLYAPQILIGQYPDEEEGYETDERNLGLEDIEQTEEQKKDTKQREIKRDIRYVDQAMLEENTTALFDVCSKYDVMVLEGIVLKGDLCSYKNVRICDHGIVCGNIFAEGDIHIGKDTVVFGNIFSQGSIVFQENARVGQQGRVVSVVARKQILFTEKAAVFGYISCEGGGKVRTFRTTGKERKTQYLKDCQEDSKLSFQNLSAYEKSGKRGYRKAEYLQTVEIPDSATEVFGSMFFQCTSLKKVTFPGTLERIGAFAFAGCSMLSKVTEFTKTRIQRIETSAFEGCAGLEGLEFPEELEYLGAAAFAGCRYLRYVSFREGSKLKVMADHCFRDCSRLEWMEVPDRVEKIGVSAFAGCVSLQYLSIPFSCAEEPGIIEVRNRTDVKLLIREERADEEIEHEKENS